jgi:hypothetical protein
MFNYIKNLFKKEEPEITFWTLERGLEDVYPPIPALEALPNWFKDIPKEILPPHMNHPGTVKACPGIVDYFKTGYVLRLWCDLKLTINEDKSWHVNAPEDAFVFTNHLDNQLIDFLPDTNEFAMVLKAHCPWRVGTPPGYGVMQLPLTYHFNKDFTVLPGVIWTDIHHEVNQQMAFYDYGEYFIPRGTPLAMYVPFKREKFKPRVSAMDDELLEKETKAYYWFASKFKGGYKEHQRAWQKKLDEESKCPFHKK